MIELTWQLFCQTGNIEAYLLLKELEENQEKTNNYMPEHHQDEEQMQTRM